MAKTVKAAPKAAPKSAPVAAVQKSKSKVKRSLIDDAKKTRVYRIKDGGGIWYKLRQRDITIYDEQTKSVRQLIYAPNENSIFADEQGDSALREQIIFKNKELYVPYTKPNLVNYMENHPDNVANGGSEFYLINEEAKAEIEIESEFAVVDAVAMVRDKSIDELLPVALYLGIDINQKNIEIKRELLKQAKSNPTGFIKMFDNPTVKVRSTIMSAIDFQILKSSNDGLRWIDSNGLIVSTPAGQDTLDVSTRFCLSEKGAVVYEEIERQLSKI
jgi:hypothetical protein